MAREVFSVKIDCFLKELFQKTVKEKGLSTCFIIETLLTAWLEGLKAYDELKVDPNVSHNTFVINQKFERVVKRARRSYREYEPEGNYYDPSVGWVHKKDEGINPLGHVIGCHCSMCRHGRFKLMAKQR